MVRHIQVTLAGIDHRSHLPAKEDSLVHPEWSTAFQSKEIDSLDFEEAVQFYLPLIFETLVTKTRQFPPRR